MKRIIFFAVILTALVSCKGYHEDKYVDISPNETAFVIPLKQGTQSGQKQFKSVEYLEEKKVAAKRIMTPTEWHDTGYMPGSGDWIPTVIVIKVDRSPITREWTSSAQTGTTKTDDRINVESSNSIGFTVGITCTASVPEEDAAKFLYWYSGKTLAQVMDANVRSYVQDVLTGEFGQRDLSACQGERKAVFEVMKKKTIDFFALRGIRIDNIGAAGEFSYTNPEIQTAINLEFVAKKKKDAAINEVAAANEYSKASEAIKAQKDLDAQVLLTTSIADAIKNGKLTWPQTLVAGQGMSMMDLYGLKNMNKK